MRHYLEIASQRLLEYEPPGLCHFGPELFALGALGAGASAAAVPAVAATTAAVAAPAAAASGILGTGIGLAELGTIASIGGTLLSANAQSEQAAYQEAVARSEAAALKQRANEEAAAAQRTAITREKQAELLQSRARAVSAASGTLATDPTQVDIEEEIAQQGRYNALSALYEGLSAARTSNYQAEIDLFKARRIKSAAPMATFGTLLSGVSSLANSRSRSRFFGSL